MSEHNTFEWKDDKKESRIFSLCDKPYIRRAGWEDKGHQTGQIFSFHLRAHNLNFCPHSFSQFSF